jgi:DNA mismatch repair protein MutL
MPPRRILALPEVVVNQIAAGEVVERPASVVKELVENSLDAGADEVLIEVEEGGLKLIRVRDNGGGIVGEDLPLALTRHATSKIGGLQDLDSLASLGFRGEALPSIGSISTLILSSRVPGSEAGWTVRTTGGAGMDGPLPAPHPPGTSVEVRDLFFNTPARRKFLRSERTELLQIQDWVRRIALGRAGLRITLRHNRRQVLGLDRPAAPLAIGDRLRQLGGPPLNAAVAVDEAAAGMRIWGWIWGPTGAGSAVEIKYLYVNGRAVRDRAVQHALWTAGEHGAGQFPAYLLHLELDPADVDVNVHPQKLEVRFHDGRAVHDFVLSAVKRAWAGTGQAAVYPSPAPVLPVEPTVREPAAPYRAAAKPSLPAARATARAVALLGGRYLVGSDGTGVTVIDAEVALQRLFAEWAGGAGAVCQTLLIPESVALDAREMEAIARHGELLARLGLDLEAAGPGALWVRGVPRPLYGAGYGALIRDIAAALAGAEPETLPALLAPHALGAAGTPESLGRLLSDLEALGAALGAAFRRLGVADVAALMGGDGAIARPP